jgi:hypothetical protein
MRHIARWNGTSWSALGSGMNGAVYALTTLPNGDLVAGGRFTTAGGVSAPHRALEWHELVGAGIGDERHRGALTTLPNGDLVAGGSFTTAEA